MSLPSGHLDNWTIDFTKHCTTSPLLTPFTHRLPCPHQTRSKNPLRLIPAHSLPRWSVGVSRVLFEPAGPNRVRVAETIRYDVSQYPGCLQWLEVPADYTFDGASIPRLLWSLIGSPFEPDYLKAACFHDWQCEHAVRYTQRTIGDEVFLQLLTDAGVPYWRRAIMFVGVRIYSWTQRRRYKP